MRYRARPRGARVCFRSGPGTPDLGWLDLSCDLGRDLGPNPTVASRTRGGALDLRRSSIPLQGKYCKSLSYLPLIPRCWLRVLLAEEVEQDDRCGAHACEQLEDTAPADLGDERHCELGACDRGEREC